MAMDSNSHPQFDSISSAIKDFAEGKFLIVLDNVERENEGDLIISAEKITTKQMAFLIRHTSGYVCCATTKERFDQLSIPRLVSHNGGSGDAFKTAFCLPVDFIEGTTTGISAADRAITSRALADSSITDPSKFQSPGHLVTLRAAKGGVLERRGHTEAAVELCRLANCSPCGVLCELVNEDGSMKRRQDCFEFSREHSIKIITIEALIHYISNVDGVI